jgi:hypothetical protein
MTSEEYGSSKIRNRNITTEEVQKEDIKIFRERYWRLNKLQVEELPRAAELILGNLVKKVRELGRFSDEGRIALETTIHNSESAILAILEEKSQHIDTLVSELRLVYNLLETRGIIINEMIAGRSYDDIITELYGTPEELKNNKTGQSLTTPHQQDALGDNSYQREIRL